MTYLVSCDNEVDGVYIHKTYSNEELAYCEYVKLSNDALINKRQFTTVKLYVTADDLTDSNAHYHLVAVFDYYY